MSEECEVIRDLLPLYADEVCSAKSRELVEDHISTCPECRSLMARLLDDRIEQNLKDEKKDVIEYGARRFRRRSTAVGSVISAVFMIPILLGVIALLYGGSWFWITSSASLFGLSVIFLPFVIRARPVKKLLGDANRWLVVLGIDGALFVNMMNMIRFNGKFNLSTILYAVAVIAGVAMVALEIIRKRGNAQGTK